MPKAPTDGYEEMFLTKAEKKRLDELGVRGEQRRKVGKGMLAGSVKEREDLERQVRIEDAPEASPVGTLHDLEEDRYGY